MGRASAAAPLFDHGKQPPMWVVRIALSRPYTFVVLALLILILSPLVILRTPTDIFPNINIPVIAVGFTFTGLNAEEIEGRITGAFERSVTTTVDNVEHIESTSYNGQAIIKIFLQPGASLDTANAQVTAIAQTTLRGLPAGTQPPLVLDFSASSVPILQLGLSGRGMSEQQLNDLSLNFLRTQLVTVPGAVVPYPYGGKQRQVMINFNLSLLQAKGLSPSDVLAAVAQQYVVLPSGTAKISEFEYDVRTNATSRTVEEMNDLPIKTVGNATIYLRDVATVSDGFAPQTNIARQNGQRGVLVSILKAGNASTLSVVDGIRELLPRIAQTLPPQLKIQPIADQSIFVRNAIGGVIREAVLAACLTALMILLFLGSWRGTVIIAVSIPLSVLTSVMVLSFLGQTINIMTLGGLALAVGILVDDATVTIENMERYLEDGDELQDAILNGASQIAVPALVSTLCICIVFVPMFMLSGVARFLFVPLAEAVVFAMLASYVLSRTLVPTMAMYLLRAKPHGGSRSRNPLARFQRGFERRFEQVRGAYHDALIVLVRRRALFIPIFLAGCVCAFGLLPWLGQDFFPNTDSGQFILHMRAKTGTRIEDTARLADQVESAIRKIIPPRELDTILDNIGLPYSTINLTHTSSGVVGAGDADIMVSLKPDHGATEGYVGAIRRALARQFPGITFYSLPADIVTQILNFGIPSPIDIQIDGADIQGNRVVADHVLEQVRTVPGVVDARIQQRFDYPDFEVDVDRTKAQQNGLTEHDVAASVLDTLSGSFQTSPLFFLNRQNGVNYNIAAQAPQYEIQSLHDLQNIPVTGPGARGASILADVATIRRSQEMASVNHYNIRRVIDVYTNVQGRDLGAVGRDIERIVDANRSKLPRGSFMSIKGQIETMDGAYASLAEGLGFSILLVYLLIVVNFQSWLDPFIIITALPAALAGIVLFLFFTGTTLSVPALMGAIMCMGVATANSILMVSFARERLAEHGDSVLAATEAGFTRFRPVLMTALAMIIGMVPMALGLGDGGEQNAPLGRAVIGGLLLATVATLVFVPTVFSLLHATRAPRLLAESGAPTPAE
jgi:CzcA family heavy metal efflux pump